jgi:hypothetical protein
MLPDLLSMRMTLFLVLFVPLLGLGLVMLDRLVS